MKAIQIFVRGFQTQDVGNQIITALGDLGFTLRTACDGSSDSAGGLIETEIAFCDELENENLAEIRDAITFTPGIVLQYRQFTLEDEGELPPVAIETATLEGYRLLDESGKTVAAGTQDQMFRIVKHHVEDGRYRIAGPEMILDVIRESGVVGPDPDGFQVQAASSEEGGQ